MMHVTMLALKTCADADAAEQNYLSSALQQIQQRKSDVERLIKAHPVRMEQWAEEMRLLQREERRVSKRLDWLRS